MKFRNLKSLFLVYKVLLLQRRPPYRCSDSSEERKVRTPQRSIAGNARRSRSRSGLGQVQQKVCTGNAVVKPGKLYAVKYQVYQHLRASRPLLKGR